MTVTINEEDRQMIVLALWKLAGQRPGRESACRELALKFEGDHPHAKLFDAFREIDLRPVVDALCREK